jgi:hypothetical protein
MGDGAEEQEYDEAEVPREARLLFDAQGKLIFVGDCAPLSFFQTVRRLVTGPRIGGGEAFGAERGRYSVLENATDAHVPPEPSFRFTGGRRRGVLVPPLDDDSVAAAVDSYLSVTAGLVDLFDSRARHRLRQDILAWSTARRRRTPHNLPDGDDEDDEDLASAVNFLVLALGCQKSHSDMSRAYFEHARDRAFANLATGSPGVGTVRAFILVALYMLLAGQINGAFLVLGVAARAAYSIGLHRAEVNARFGSDIGRRRDRLWKSLRVVDLFFSTSMGRPPATSDVDCTVAYRGDGGTKEDESFDLLDASVQIFLIVERIVVEVYSRRRISPQLTEGISRDLRDWSSRWLTRLKAAVAASTTPSNGDHVARVNGACQVLSTYYYAVILVSRPFLMYEFHRRLSDHQLSGSISGKSKLADACIDAASLMIDPVRDLINRALMNRRAPVAV